MDFYHFYYSNSKHIFFFFILKKSLGYVLFIQLKFIINFCFGHTSFSNSFQLPIRFQYLFFLLFIFKFFSAIQMSLLHFCRLATASTVDILFFLSELQKKSVALRLLLLQLFYIQVTFSSLLSLHIKFNVHIIFNTFFFCTDFLILLHGNACVFAEECNYTSSGQNFKDFKTYFINKDFIFLELPTKKVIGRFFKKVGLFC